MLLEEVIETAKQLDQIIIGPVRAHRLPGRTKNVAAFAASTLPRLTGTPPTKTVNGPFYELASLLYEGATGIEGADLQRSCRSYLSQQNVAQSVTKGKDSP